MRVKHINEGYLPVKHSRLVEASPSQKTKLKNISNQADGKNKKERTKTLNQKGSPEALFNKYYGNSQWGNAVKASREIFKQRLTSASIADGSLLNHISSFGTLGVNNNFWDTKTYCDFIAKTWELNRINASNGFAQFCVNAPEHVVEYFKKAKQPGTLFDSIFSAFVPLHGKDALKYLNRTELFKDSSMFNNMTKLSSQEAYKAIQVDMQWSEDLDKKDDIYKRLSRIIHPNRLVGQNDVLNYYQIDPKDTSKVKQTRSQNANAAARVISALAERSAALRNEKGEPRSLVEIVTHEFIDDKKKEKQEINIQDKTDAEKVGRNIRRDLQDKVKDADTVIKNISNNSELQRAFLNGFEGKTN